MDIANIQDIIMDHTRNNIRDVVCHQEKILKDSLRENAIPPITGEITKGKLLWRGIRLVQTQHTIPWGGSRWLEQRGKRISPIIRYDVSIDPFATKP